MAADDSEDELSAEEGEFFKSWDPSLMAIASRKEGFLGCWPGMLQKEASEFGRFTAKKLARTYTPALGAGNFRPYRCH